MKSCSGILLALLAWGLSEPQTLLAQTLYYNGSLYRGGMFGDRVLGQSLAPRPNNFSGDIQTAPSGAFLYIGSQTSTGGFATPWRQIDPLVTMETVSPPPGGRPVLQIPALLEGVPGSPLPPGTVPAVFPPAVPSATAPVVEAGPPLNPNPNNPAGATNAAPTGPSNNAAPTPQASTAASTGQTTAAPPVAGPPATAYVALSENSPPAATSAARSTAWVRSARLSELVTRVAQGRNLLAGQGINVYVSDHLAVLQGAVRTADYRDLLANVVNLEPGVWQVENRLTVGPPAATESRPASPRATSP